MMIGPPPRTVRWPPCLAHRAVLAILGAALLVAATAVSLSYARLEGPILPFEDAQLSERASRAEGKILSVEPVGKTSMRLVRFEFRDGQGQSHQSQSYSTNVVSPGPARIEFLPEAPDISRIEGSLRAGSSWTVTLACFVIAPLGVVLLWMWLRSALAMRVRLREGRVVVGDLLNVKTQGRPPTVQIQFAFTDGARGRIEATRKLRRSSARTQEILAAGHLNVLIDPDHPDSYHLVAASDFSA